MSSRLFRERLDVPPAVLVAVFGMLAIAGINVTRVLQAAVTPEDDYAIGIVIGVALAASIMLSFLPFLAAWALRSAWKSAPILATIVGAWAAPHVLGYTDILSVICGAAAIAAVIAVWLPSARKYGRELRALRES